MLNDQLYVIKRSNINLPSKKYSLIDNDKEVAIIEASDIYSALYDFFQYHIEKRQAYVSRVTHYDPMLSGTIPGLPYFIQSLMIVRAFSMKLIIEYVKKAATSEYETYYLKLK